MAKTSTRTAATSAGHEVGDADRHVDWLQRRLAAAREAEAKRTRQATKARGRGASRDLEVKRRRQLDKAHRRAAALEAEIASLRDAAAAGEGTAPAESQVPVSNEPGPRAYCLRERLMVEMVDPRPMVMRNGRAGVAGACPGCGARLVRPSLAV